jgi:hypothetical protein
MGDGYESYASPKEEKPVWSFNHFADSHSGKPGVGANCRGFFALPLAILKKAANDLKD